MILCVLVCMQVLPKCLNAIKFNQISHSNNAPVTTCHSVTSNCSRVYVCVFLLSTAHHRNGKPVSTATLFCVNVKQGCMLHVTNYSGNVVMVLCISLSQASSILLLLGFWAAYHHPLAKSHVIRGHGGAVFWLSTCSYNTCMCLSPFSPTFF